MRNEQLDIKKRKEREKGGMETQGTEIWRGEETQDAHVDLFRSRLPMKETRTGVESSCYRK
jgi:hypothetical protein